MAPGLSEHPTVDREPVRAASVSAATRPSFDVVLDSKLHIPRVRKDWVKRPALVHDSMSILTSARTRFCVRCTGRCLRSVLRFRV
jgi:hypothetical protein